ncbi:hypothetical protein Tco_0818031 [Tanacetum coccineum]
MANLSSLPTSAEQHLHTTDILKNRRMTDTNDTITLRPTKVETTIPVIRIFHRGQDIYEQGALTMVNVDKLAEVGGLDSLTLNSLYDEGAYKASQQPVYGSPALNLFKAAGPFGMFAPAGQ